MHNWAPKAQLVESIIGGQPGHLSNGPQDRQGQLSHRSHRSAAPASTGPLVQLEFQFLSEPVQRSTLHDRVEHARTSWIRP